MSEPVNPLFANFDSARFGELVRQFSKDLNVRPDGWWKTASPSALWKCFLLQILVTQSTGGDKEAAFVEGQACRVAFMEGLDVLVTRRGERGAMDAVAEALRSAGLRMATKKANWIVTNYLDQAIVRRPAGFVLLDRLAALDPIGLPSQERVEREMRGRTVVRTAVKGFGSKSASDYLLEIGWANSLVAFDIRVMKCVRRLGVPLSVQEVQGDSGLYGELERFLRDHVCPAYGITPKVLDRMFYQHEREISAWLEAP